LATARVPQHTRRGETHNSINDIVGAYKSLVAKKCLDISKLKNKTLGKLWQRNYYDHIIRDEKGYQNISDYIINNPSIGLLTSILTNNDTCKG
jgi:REP element-mobilizing transposase RayT